MCLQLASSGSGSGSVSVRGSGSGSSSGSASEVEVGEEARGVVWLPDSAAPRCQYCSNHFWLARRRHHCRYVSATASYRPMRSWYWRPRCSDVDIDEVCLLTPMGSWYRRPHVF